MSIGQLSESRTEEENGIGFETYRKNYVQFWIDEFFLKLESLNCPIKILYKVDSDTGPRGFRSRDYRMTKSSLLRLCY